MSEAKQFKLNRQREKAAFLVAQGGLTNKQIAEKVPIAVSTLSSWKRFPEFQEAVEKFIHSEFEALQRIGIGNRFARVMSYNDRLQRMNQLIAARGAEMEETGEVAGGETGLLVRDYKGKDADKPIYHFDAALVREMRELEKQIAIECGQWTERREITGKIDVTKLSDEELAAIVSAEGAS